MSTVNPDGSAVVIEAVYYRYHACYVEEFDTIEEAQGFCDSGEDYGEMSSVGVYVNGEPHSHGPWDWKPPGVARGYGGALSADDMRREYVKAGGALASRSTESGSSERGEPRLALDAPSDQSRGDTAP